MSIDFRSAGHSGAESNHYYRQATAPTGSDPLDVGDLWSDTTANLLKRCTSVSPVTFVSVEGGSSAHDLFSSTHGDVDETDTPADGQVLKYDSVSGKWRAEDESAASTQFADAVFRIQDDGDASKEIAFQASGITTGTTRTITMPDTDVDLGDLATDTELGTHEGNADVHHSRSHDHSIGGDGTTLSPATLNLPTSATPTPTTEGELWWDTDNRFVVGNGASQSFFPSTAAMSGEASQTSSCNVQVATTHAGSAHHNEDHAARHADGGADELAVQDLASDAAADGQVPKADGAGAVTFEDDLASVTVIIDGGGSAITSGVKAYVPVPFACVIERVELLADQTGSIVIDIWKDTYANYPPTDADTITGGNEPTISSGVKDEDETLTSWTTTISQGDILGFNVDSITTVARVTVALRVRKT